MGGTDRTSDGRSNHGFDVETGRPYRDGDRIVCTMGPVGPGIRMPRLPALYRTRVLPVDNVFNLCF